MTHAWECPLEREKLIYPGAFETLLILLCYLGVMCHIHEMTGSTVISIPVRMRIQAEREAMTGPRQVTPESVLTCPGLDGGTGPALAVPGAGITAIFPPFSFCIHLFSHCPIVDMCQLNKSIWTLRTGDIFLARATHTALFKGKNHFGSWPSPPWLNWCGLCQGTPWPRKGHCPLSPSLSGAVETAPEFCV